MTDKEQRSHRSVDAFHRGRFEVIQSKCGHRAGLDALLLAATAVEDGVRYADFGAGAGVVGFAIASRLRNAKVTLIERDTVSILDAVDTLELPINAGLKPRVQVLNADVLHRGAEREASGLRPGSFEHVVANPPFQLAGRGRPSPNARRAAAHAMTVGLLADWSRTAAATLVPRGTLTMILRPENLPDLIEAWSGRFSGPTVVPIHTSEKEPASRILVRGTAGMRGPFQLLPALLIRDGGAQTELAELLTDGEATIQFG